ncbi:MAG TPA: ABC transporter transmembrane domain-containing protein [Chloroflexota bacterium]|nr:ABC transporter transmembrane domain-containing protein [Chloroflexota bacterium]
MAVLEAERPAPPISDAAQQQGAAPFLGAEQEQFRLASDLDGKGRYGERWLVVTDRHVYVFDTDPDGSRKPTLSLDLADIKDARTEAAVSGEHLLVETHERVVEAIRYTRTLSPHFSDAARGIKQLAEGHPLLRSDKLPKLRCERCGRLMPGRHGRCPACVRAGAVLLRIAGYLKPYKAVTAAVVVATLSRTLLQLIPPLVNRQMIDGALRSGQTGNLSGRFHLVAWLVAILVGVALANAVMQSVSQWLAAVLGSKITSQMRGDVYRKLERLPLAFHNDRGTGSLMSLISQDTASLEQFLVQGVPFIATNVLMFFFILMVLFKVQWALALIILIPVPFVILGSRHLWKQMSRLYRRWWRVRAGFSTQLSESLLGIRVSKAFAQEDREVERFSEQNQIYRDAGIKTTVTSQRLSTGLNFINSSGVFLVWLFGGHDVIYGVITLGTLVMFNSYLSQFYAPLQYFNQVSQWMSQAFAGAERVFEVLDAPEEPYDERGAVAVANIKGQVEFRDVSFSYERGKPVLKDVNVAVEPGEMIGLVGKSGSGKSTFINLISRFYDPDYGQILVDGIELKELRLRDLRDQVGIVLQDPFLFNGTIAENIAYARPDAAFRDIVAAARAANAHDFIIDKDDGYSTRVGERGHRLSGGERQRISIARAILRDPKILILDEATASVDTETEKAIQDALARLVKGRTTFAIAHRLSTLRNADRLFVFDDGEIKEVGTHDELMERSNGIYRRLVDLQREVSKMKAVDG